MAIIKPEQLGSGLYSISGSFSGSFQGSHLGTSSYAVDALSSSYASTASHAPLYLPLTGGTITGPINISGNTTITGSITAINQTASFGYVSSSFIDVTGKQTVRGYLQFYPTADVIPITQTGSYIYSSGSEGDMYFAQTNGIVNNVIRLRWLEGNMYSGLLNGGVISTQSATTYQVSSGSGLIVSLNGSLNSDPYPAVQYLTWPNLSSSIAPLSASFDQSFVSIEPSGSEAIIFVQGTPYDDGQFNTLIPIGNVIHQNRSTINAVATYPSVAYGYKQRSSDFIRAFGPLKLSGLNTIVSGSSTGSLQITSGTSYNEGRNYVNDVNNPSYVIDTGQPISKIFRYYQSGSAWIYLTNGGAGFETIDPTQYSLNGVLTPVPGTGANRQFSIQRIYYFPGGATKGIYVYYGNTTYTSAVDAIANIPYENFTEAPNTAAGAVLSAYLVVRNNADFTIPASYNIRPAGLFRNIGGSGGGGSAVTQTLASLTDVNVLTPPPTDGQPLAYDATTLKWENRTYISASLAGNASTATTASYALSALSASYAPSTPTFPYTGSALITGSLGVTGSVSVLAGTNGTSSIFNVRNSTNTSNLITVKGNSDITFLTENPVTSGGILIEKADNYFAGSLKFYNSFGSQGITLDNTINTIRATNLRAGSISGNGYMGLIESGSQIRYLKFVDAFANEYISLGGSNYDGGGGISFTLKTTTTNGTNFVTFSRSNNTNPVVINDSGYVGIGTSTPAARLDVKAQGALSTDIAFRVRNSADTQNLMSIAGDGQIAIGLNASISSVSNPIPQDSVVIGRGATAGLYATAIGAASIAEYYSSVAIGRITRAGIESVAIGYGATAFNPAIYPTLAIGYNAIASGIHSAVISVGNPGITNTIASSFAFGIHNGGNAQSLFFNRNTNIVLRSNTALTPGTHFDTNATNTITIHSGSIPASNISNSFQLYASASIAGNAAPHFRTAAGNIVKLYSQAPVTSSQGIADALTNLGFLTGSSTIASTAPFPYTGSALITGSLGVTGSVSVRAPGALSTDIAFRVRNSGDTANIISISGNGQFTLGLNSSTAGATAVTIGGNASTNSGTSIAVGYGANTGAASDSSMAIGYAASVNGSRGVALGFLTNVTGDAGVSLGERASVTATNGIAIGTAASITANGSFVVGANATNAIINSNAFTNGGLNGYSFFNDINSNYIINSSVIPVNNISYINTTKNVLYLGTGIKPASTIKNGVQIYTNYRTISQASSTVGATASGTANLKILTFSAGTNMSLLTVGTRIIVTNSSGEQTHANIVSVTGLAVTIDTALVNINSLTLNATGTTVSNSTVVIVSNFHQETRNDNGNIIKLYTQAAVTSSQGIADALTNLGFLTGSSTIASTAPFPYTGSALITGSLGVTGSVSVRAPGALSTDIAFRVRNSADNDNLIESAGNGLIKFRNGSERIEIDTATADYKISAYKYSVEMTRISTYLSYFCYGSSNQYLGIGTNTPSHLLDINSAGTNVILTRFGNDENSIPGSDLSLKFTTRYTGGAAGGNPLAYLTIGGTGAGVNSNNKSYFKFLLSRSNVLAERASITSQSNLLLQAPIEDTNDVGVIYLPNGTAPTSSITDGVKQYSADIVAGNAAPHFRTENGSVIKLYKQDLPTNPTNAEIATFLSNLGLANLI